MRNQNITWHQKHTESLTIGHRIADKIANVIGSWPFIIAQTLFVLVWMGLNLLAYFKHWDPYPFILLNLVFSTQAAYAAPIIMMAQNRQGERDRHQALEDYQTNVAAKLEIEQLQIAVHRIENVKLDKIIALLEAAQKKTLK